MSENVYQDTDGKWYFLEETFSNLKFGPFDSKEAAENGCADVMEPIVALAEEMKAEYEEKARRLAERIIV